MVEGAEEELVGLAGSVEVLVALAAVLEVQASEEAASSAVDTEDAVEATPAAACMEATTEVEEALVAQLQVEMEDVQAEVADAADLEPAAA